MAGEVTRVKLYNGGYTNGHYRKVAELEIVPDKGLLPRKPENAKAFDWRDALTLAP
ncbi:hypothetical protein [Thermococcus gorgonarius]|uniref:hypothetical protein n=1 Tax=Thermococcus gorgonarius TaxID=71997 RepID=UPI0012FDFD99|nr:hypothetical protein [Thermococcus gorgonarius]